MLRKKHIKQGCVDKIKRVNVSTGNKKKQKKNQKQKKDKEKKQRKYPSTQPNPIGTPFRPVQTGSRPQNACGNAFGCLF